MAPVKTMLQLCVWSVLEAANVLIVHVCAGMLLCEYATLFVCLYRLCVVYVYVSRCIYMHIHDRRVKKIKHNIR
jgi:hypothetical protein